MDESVMLTFCRENIIVDMHSRSSRLKGVKHLSGGPKFKIKHKSHCVQTKKLVNWGPGPPLAPALLL